MITIKDIEKLAALARIHLEESEKDSLSKEIDSILGYVAQIQAATANVAPNENYLRNVMREDSASHETGVFTQVLLKAAPDRDGQYFKVKKILS